MFLGNYTHMMWSSISMMSSSSVKISSVTFKDLLKNVRFNESHSRPLFLHFRLFFKQLTGTIGSIKVTDNWIQTTDLWCRKRPLCQLYHNHCPLTKFLLTSCFCSWLKYSDIFFFRAFIVFAIRSISYMFWTEKLSVTGESVTRKKSPNVYKCCLKTISLEKL